MPLWKLREGCSERVQSSGGESEETISHTTAWKLQNHFDVQTAYLVARFIIWFWSSICGRRWQLQNGQELIKPKKEKGGGTLKMSCDWCYWFSGSVSRDVSLESMEAQNCICFRNLVVVSVLRPDTLSWEISRRSWSQAAGRTATGGAYEAAAYMSGEVLPFSSVCVLLYIQTSHDASDCSDLNHLKRSMTRKGTDLFMWPAENLTFLVVLFYRCSFILIFIILNSNNNNNKALQ